MTRSTLAESVADVLRHAIFQGAYHSGERLVELTIADEMHVSQNTAREALRLLEQDGLVVKRARLGTHIRSYTGDEALELYTLWATLESLTLMWALGQVTDSQLNHLHDLVNTMHASVLSDRVGEALALRFQFHETVAQMARKPQTSAILQRLRNQVRLLENLRQRDAPRTRAQWKTQIAYCEALIEALRRGDVERAQAHLRACIQADSDVLAAVLG